MILMWLRKKALLVEITDYLTVRQTAEKWGVTARWVQFLVKDGRITEAVRLGNAWLIHKDAVKPCETRNRKKNNGKVGEKHE